MAFLLRGLECCRRLARPPKPLRWFCTPAVPSMASAAADAIDAAARLAAHVAKRRPRSLPKARTFHLLNMKTSAQKVAVVARLVNVRGLSVQAAVGHLKFLPQKAAVLLRGVLDLALRRGPLENDMDPNRMVIGARARARRGAWRDAYARWTASAAAVLCR